MTNEKITIEDLIGKTVTDIRCKYGIQDGWLDTAECFIELDNTFFIRIPLGESTSVFKTEVDSEAKTIFNDLSDIPTYFVNKEGKSVSEIVEMHKKRKRNFINRIKKILFGYDPPIKEYKPYKVEYNENKLKYIIDRKIVDYLWENEEIEAAIFELDNGYFISEQYMAPSGTGMAGLHLYDNFDHLKNRRGENIRRLSETAKDSD